MAQRDIDNTILSWKSCERVAEFIMDNDPNQEVCFDESEVWQLLDNIERVGMSDETLTAMGVSVPSILPDSIPTIGASPEVDASGYIYQLFDNLDKLEAREAGMENHVTGAIVETNNENQVVIAQVETAPENDSTQVEEPKNEISRDTHAVVVPGTNPANKADHPGLTEKVWQHDINKNPAPVVPRVDVKLLGNFTTGEIAYTEMNEAANKEKRPFLVFGTEQEKLEVANLLGKQYVKDLMLAPQDTANQGGGEANKKYEEPVLDVEGKGENFLLCGEYTEEEEIMAWKIIRGRARLMMRKRKRYDQ